MHGYICTYKRPDEMISFVWKRVKQYKLFCILTGNWLCPRHRCKICSAASIKLCSLCPSSYCSGHYEGRLVEDANGDCVCSNHGTLNQTSHMSGCLKQVAGSDGKKRSRATNSVSDENADDKPKRGRKPKRVEQHSKLLTKRKTSPVTLKIVVHPKKSKKL